MQSKAKGTLLTILSAVFYGLNPLMAKTIYTGGCNATTLSFLRAFTGIFLFLLLYRLTGGKSLRISRRQLRDVAICSIGYALIGPLLFASYNYLASGLATTVHFVYPVLVVIACILFRYEKPNRRKLLCCALSFAGILCFYTPGGEVSAYGVLLAFASGVAWAFYIVHLNSSGVVNMPPFLLAFWLCLFSAAIIAVIALVSNQFAWPTTALSLGTLGIYCCIAATASLLFQIGNKYIGAQSASMLSTFEPLTSVVIGVLVYHEVLTLRLGVGIVCILLAVFLLASAKEEEPAKTEV